jgi:mRNA-degrading endonuclease RelE of RelBE toxin-antitoxin system
VRVTILDAAERDLAWLPGAVQAQVFEVVRRLERWPQISGVKKLLGQWRGFSRVRTGDYRVVFAVYPDRICIVRVAHRREVYE